MDRLLRWFVAGTVTLVAFVVGTWVAGAVVLPHLMGSADSRWVVASGVGAAAAALAALWGFRFATREASAEDPAGTSVTASGAGSIAVGGDLSGSASTGGREATARPPAARKDAADHVARPGQVTASGPNSIAAGGDLSGSASTGDDVESSPT
jgi:hypothetical protein